MIKRSVVRMPMVIIVPLGLKTKVRVRISGFSGALAVGDILQVAVLYDKLDVVLGPKTLGT